MAEHNREEISGSLSVVGSGIRLSQMSVETRAAIERADKVFYLVADPITYSWILNLPCDAEDLHSSYSEEKDRKYSYMDMVDRIMSCVREGMAVCVISYGHPGVFAFPMHESIRQARREGFPARMLPGISSEDCLFADLGIDPGERGCQSFEATDFLVFSRRFDSSSPLILWQIGVTGDLGYKHHFRLDGLRVLVEVLEKSYSPTHEVVLYEASSSSVANCVIHRIALQNLLETPVTPISTLYVPPITPSVPDSDMLARLGINVSALREKS